MANPIFVSTQEQKLQATTLLMAIGVGVAVANIYYCQPLLGIMAQDLHVSERHTGWIATLTQVGTAIGMLLFVPLGDIAERRKLTVRMCVFVAFAALLTALAPSFSLLALFSFLLGLGSVIPHLILPFAAHLAPEGARGKVVAKVISGMLVGILLARTVAGFVGAAFGWRAIFFISAGLMLGLAIAFRELLPESHPSVQMHYFDLLRSVGSMVREHRGLRESAAIGALLFASFSAFWTTLVFFLAKPPYHYGARMAGGLGLLAAASAALAPIVGRMVDRRSPKLGISIAVITTLASYAVMIATGHWLIGLGLGVILLDVGVQTGHISNQTRIYNTFPHARSRANTVYMVSYFVGGAFGSALGNAGWHFFGWAGVCAAGAVVLLPALLIVRTMREEKMERVEETELSVA
ncbi:major facilitator superfamily (MFS) transporter [Candidatus Koribacter versatilis Ellin345]|uniref:Major facilitator superfamily (MFS) transporter n=2 Tax=Candidatus Korobacter versatilis TaxID=658062 RepID=Q1II22_KORVE|nr:major facilitator superfamily (MFS) transporter [Candidatus Koribacter versatilis Ellin345]